MGLGTRGLGDAGTWDVGTPGRGTRGRGTSGTRGRDKQTTHPNVPLNLQLTVFSG